MLSREQELQMDAEDAEFEEFVETWGELLTTMKEDLGDWEKVGEEIGRICNEQRGSVH